jgi:hypothetical protein
VDITFFQKDGACPHTANGSLDVLHNVFESISRVLQMWVVLATMVTGHESLWGYLKDCMYLINLHTVQGLQAETESVAGM